jgi:predicted transcriptional regulator
MSEMQKKKPKQASKSDKPVSQSGSDAEDTVITQVEDRPLTTASSFAFTPFPNAQSSPTVPEQDVKRMEFSPFPPAASFATDQNTLEISNDLPLEPEAEVFTPKVMPEITENQVQAAKRDPFEVYAAEYEQLQPLEKEVLEIAKEILKLKRFDADVAVKRLEYISPLMEELLSKCVAKLTYTKGYSKEDIFKAIQTLEKGKWLVSAQRRTKQEVLESPVLQGILKFIHDHPGTHARDPLIESELKITRNPFIKHVMVLESFELIRTKKIGRTQNYFGATIPEIFDDFVVLFANPLVPQIIQLLLKNPMLTLSDLAREVGVYHGAIQYHLKSLMNMNILFKNDNNYTVNRELLRRYNSLHKIPPFAL